MKCFVLKLSAVLPEFSLGGDLFKLKVSSPGKRRRLQIIKHITLEAWIGKDNVKDKHTHKHKVNDKDKWE